MEYIQVTFTDLQAEKQEVFIALLAEAGFDSFQEKPDELVAFIDKEAFDEEAMKSVLSGFGEIEYQLDTISEKNWNKAWEQNYPPVIIPGKCRVRAPFHEADDTIPYDIVIEPQMSFGTAHHDTTALMLDLMFDMDLNNKVVLDMGSGTGILAIMACLKNAARAWAIDNNIWAYNNSIHNIELNNIHNIEVVEGDKSAIPDMRFDVILANINRNILLEDIPEYVEHLNPGGEILLSGFLEQDKGHIFKKCQDSGLTSIRYISNNEWIAAAFLK